MGENDTFSMQEYLLLMLRPNLFIQRVFTFSSARLRIALKRFLRESRRANKPQDIITNFFFLTSSII